MSSENQSAITTETGALDAPNVQRVRDYQAAMAQGRMSDALAVFASNVRYVVPGNNRLSGEYVGGEAVMGYFGRLMELTGGTYRITNMEWLVCGEDVLVETTNTANIESRSLIWREAILFRFQNGKKSFIELFQADQSAVDNFYGK